MAGPKRKSFALRIDPKLWQDVEAWAHQEFRSVNAQIEFILKEAVKKRKKNSSDEENSDERE